MVSRLTTKEFERKATELWKYTKYELYSGSEYARDSPRDAKNRNDAIIARMAPDFEHVRWEFTSVICDLDKNRAVLFEDIDFKHVWIPRSVIKHYSASEGIALVKSWFLKKNGMI